MIAFLDDHPLVRFPDGRTFAFERRWLEGCLEAAAVRAGYEQWWLSGHVTESVSAFLKNDFEETVLNVDGLERAVKTVLESIGYGDVAEHYKTLPPPVRLSLLDTARKAGEGFELLFFEILRQQLEEALESGSRCIECDGLHDCVKFLRRAKVWRRDCTGLRLEIVEFIETHVTRNAASEEHFYLQLL